MSIATSISRFAAYLRRHSLGDTLSRVRLELTRALFASRMIVYYCDLTKLPVAPARTSPTFSIERLSRLDALPAQDLHDMTSFWNPPQALQRIRERFDRGASVWLARSGDHLAGYGWSLKGSTMEPHFFPLSPDDVHLFDFHVFPKYRGQGINPLLVNHILYTMSHEGITRAYIEAAEWNNAQLSSLAKTPFRRMGMVRSFAILSRQYVSWANMEPLAEAAKEHSSERESFRAGEAE